MHLTCISKVQVYMFLRETRKEVWTKLTKLAYLLVTLPCSPLNPVREYVLGCSGSYVRESYTIADDILCVLNLTELDLNTQRREKVHVENTSCKDWAIIRRR